MAMVIEISPDKEALSQAIALLGGQGPTAEMLEGALARQVSQQHISAALLRLRKIPGEWAIPIERATKGKITRHQIRPDLYPAGRAA